LKTQDKPSCRGC